MNGPKKPESTQPIPTIGSSASITRPTRIISGTASPRETTGVTKSLSVGTGDPESEHEKRIAERRRYHRLGLLKKRKAALVAEITEEAEARMRWTYRRNVGLIVLGVAIAAYLWAMLDLGYGNQWPVLAIWGLLSVGVVSGFGAAVWWMNRGRL
ncbi:MAG: hypothetical protein JNK60_07515 [Acidobacteria bacterium]|nr:hypothetical protein [Acidobacteriota bacterium]